MKLGNCLGKGQIFQGAEDFCGTESGDRKVVITSRLGDVLFAVVVISGLVLVCNFVLLGAINVISLGGAFGMLLLDVLSMLTWSISVAFLLVSGACFYFSRKKFSFLSEIKSPEDFGSRSRGIQQVYSRARFVSQMEVATQTGEDALKRVCEADFDVSTEQKNSCKEKLSVEVVEAMEELVKSETLLESDLAEKASSLKEPLESMPTLKEGSCEIVSAMTGFFQSLQFNN
ncbi:hypothetical protein [Chlamydiifrater volucris]|uniref:hypothetical protein n=1 Tax=Chlamydiifrater volucris TaxID=2681470 RepID=UPI001BCCA068|nr:hypothetical protein [Chlamydiifrater volucris]